MKDIGYLRLYQDVDKNHHVLKEIIHCLRFCGTHELPIRGHDESSDPLKQGVFLGLVDLTARLDSQLANHLKHATVFKGTSHRIQNELLDCMFSIYRKEVEKEVQEASFVSIQADDTTDVSCVTQSVLILRYMKNKKIVERFHGFLQPLETTAAGLSDMILIEIEHYHIKEKLTALIYDGAAVMSGRRSGVQVKICEQYPNAVFIHCYAPQLNLVMQKVASSITTIKVFFANLFAFPKKIFNVTKENFSFRCNNKPKSCQGLSPKVEFLQRNCK